MAKSKQKWVPDRGEVIWIDHNPQSGREMRDFHPMLVLSPQNFNEVTGTVIGLPMTTAEYNKTNPFAVKVTHLKKTSYVLAHQPKSFDWKQRAAKPHPWKTLPEDAILDACDVLNQIIELN